MGPDSPALRSWMSMLSLVAFQQLIHVLQFAVESVECVQRTTMETDSVEHGACALRRITVSTMDAERGGRCAGRMGSSTPVTARCTAWPASETNASESTTTNLSVSSATTNTISSICCNRQQVGTNDAAHVEWDNNMESVPFFR